VLALETHCAQHGIQELSRSADEWFALSVLVSARRFANDQQISRLATGTENGLATCFVKLAALASRHRGTQRSPIQRFHISRIHAPTWRSSAILVSDWRTARTIKHCTTGPVARHKRGNAHLGEIRVAQTIHAG
jgi:hypothetical protein